jgi:hypothetical protein
MHRPDRSEAGSEASRTNGSTRRRRLRGGPQWSRATLITIRTLLSYKKSIGRDSGFALARPLLEVVEDCRALQIATKYSNDLDSALARVRVLMTVEIRVFLAIDAFR